MLKVHLAPSPAIPYLDKYQRNSHTSAQGEDPKLFVVSECVIGKKWKRPKIYQQENGQINWGAFIRPHATRELKGVKQSCV